MNDRLAMIEEKQEMIAGTTGNEIEAGIGLGKTPLKMTPENPEI